MAWIKCAINYNNEIFSNELILNIGRCGPANVCVVEKSLLSLGVREGSDLNGLSVLNMPKIADVPFSKKIASNI